MVKTEVKMRLNSQPFSIKKSRVVFFSGAVVAFGLLAGAGCNAGEDIIPDVGGSGGSAGSTPIIPNGGMVAAAGTTAMPTAGSSTAIAGSTSGGSSTGGSGGGSSGGTGGADTGGSGGSGGAPENLADAVKGWHGWRMEMPCKTYAGGQPLDDACSQGDICWVGNDSVAPHKEEKAIVMAGDPTKVYEFELWARGVIEPKVHVGCERITMPKYAGGIAICKGGGDSNSGFNLWSITIDDPPQIYWMNDSDTDTHRTDVLDGKFKVQARGGTKVTFKFDNKNTGQINNGCPSLRKVIEGVAPYPAYYKGNFFQLDVTEGSVKTVP
jgi:hypothetical protein